MTLKTKATGYVIENFDVYDTELIKRLVEFFIDKYPSLKIKTDDEMTGWTTTVNTNELYRMLDEKSKKQYTSLDVISLELDGNTFMQIVYHECNAFLVS